MRPRESIKLYEMLESIMRHVVQALLSCCYVTMITEPRTMVDGARVEVPYRNDNAAPEFRFEDSSRMF